MNKFHRILVLFLLIITVTTISLNNITQSSTQDMVFASPEQAVSLENLNSYILVDYNSGIVLKEKNSTQKFEIASMVKLMTTLLVMESIENGKFSLDDLVTISEYAASQEGSEAFLEPNKNYSIDELLKSVIIASANDSSVALAECLAGSEMSFVKLMNERAKSLKMNNTLYANATGLPASNQYSTSYDVSLLLKEIIKHPLYYKYSKIWMDKLTHYDGRITELVNTNRLVKDYPYCDLGKTGFTDEAGYCLSASATKNGMKLISVVMGAKTSKDRFTCSKQLLNYGFNNYENKKFIDCLNPLKDTLNVENGKIDTVEIYYNNDYYHLSPKGENTTLEFKIDIPDKIYAPINEGEKVGVCYVTENGVVLAEIDLIVKENIEKVDFKYALERIFKNW